MKLLPKLFFIQGAYYFLTGLWPLVHLPSFLAVTGPKQDVWLVHMVGLLTCAIALVLLLAAFRGRRTWEMFSLAFFSALSYAAIDLYYGFRGVIPLPYRVEGFLELGYAGLLLGYLLGPGGKAGRH